MKSVKKQVSIHITEVSEKIVEQFGEEEKVIKKFKKNSQKLVDRAQDENKTTSNNIITKSLYRVKTI